MATSVAEYVSACMELVEAKPKYAKNKSNLQECDCIGMDKYAFRKCGVSFSSSGVNYTARKHVDNLMKIKSPDDLTVGDVVLKAREPGHEYYDLPERYKPGGKDYNGDLMDYYHIGTVKSVRPLEIIHMTDPTSKIDTSLCNWAYVARWKDNLVMYDDPVPDPEPEPEPEPIILPDTAVVWADNGKPVNLRKRPSKAAALVDRVPVNSSVEILEKAEDWCHVKWKNKVGYIMTEYLIFPDMVLFAVYIPHLEKEQAEALVSMYPGAEMIEEVGGRNG